MEGADDSTEPMAAPSMLLFFVHVSSCNLVYLSGSYLSTQANLTDCLSIFSLPLYISLYYLHVNMYIHTTL